jgi:hypothetical protein
VILLELVPATNVQGDLWEEPDNQKSRALMRVMDRLNDEFGQDTISMAVSGRQRPWGLNANSAHLTLRRTGMSYYRWPEACPVRLRVARASTI